MLLFGVHKESIEWYDRVILSSSEPRIGHKSGHRYSRIVHIIKCLKDKLCCCCWTPSTATIWCPWPGYSFLGSGGESTKVVIVDLKARNKIKTRRWAGNSPERKMGRWKPKLGWWVTTTWRPRWSYVRLVGLTRCRRKGQSSRESSEQRQTIGIRVRQTDSGPWAGPNQNGRVWVAESANFGTT